MIGKTTRHKFGIIATFCFCIAGSVGLIYMFDPTKLSDFNIKIAYAIVLLLLIFVFLLERKIFTRMKFPGWSHPPQMILLWVIILWGFPGLISVINRSLLSTNKILLDLDNYYSALGMFMVLVGLICLFLAYLIGLKVFKTVSYFGQLKDKPIKPVILIIIYIASLCALILQIKVAGIAFGVDRSAWGELSSLQQWLSYIQDLGLLIIAIVVGFVVQKKINPVILLSMVSIQVLISFSSGFIKPILWLGLVLLFSFMASGINRKKLIMPVILLLVFIIIIVPISESLRDQVENNEFDTKNIGEVLLATQYAFQNTWLRGLSVSWDIFINKALVRQAIVANAPGIVLLRTPALIPYQGLEEFLNLPAYIIPRVLFPNKPSLSKGIWFSINYFNLPSTTISSAAITIFGEGYYIAGWIGTFIASCIIGLLLSFIFKNSVCAGLFPVFIALIPKFLDVEGQFTGMFVSLIQSWVVFMAVYIIMVLMSKIRRVYAWS